MKSASHVAAIVALFTIVQPAHAEQPAKPAAPVGALPGVDPAASGGVFGFRPKPETNDNKSVGADGDGFIRMGDWNVKISGYARVDIATGSRRGAKD